MKLINCDFPLVNPCWLLLMTFLFFMCLEVVSRISCSITTSRSRWGWLVSGSNILHPAFHAVRSGICFPPVLGHLSQSLLSFKDDTGWLCDDISSFLSTCGCISSGPICPVCWSIPWPDPLSWNVNNLCSRFSPCSLGPGIPGRLFHQHLVQYVRMLGLGLWEEEQVAPGEAVWSFCVVNALSSFAPISCKLDRARTWLYLLQLGDCTCVRRTGCS